MASGKQTKRRRAQARATPPPVQRKGERHSASPKVLIAVAAVLVLIGAAVGIALAVTGGSSSSSSSTRLAEASEVRRIFRGIPQRSNVLGSPKAPVTMIEYIDLQCPGCQAFETQIFPTLVARYIRTGKLKVEARPIAFIGPDSQRGRLAALAAARQNKFFNFAELLYFNQGPENSGWLDDGIVKAAATSIPGVDVARLLSTRTSGSIANQAKGYDSAADADHVSETPTLLVGKTGGKAQGVVPSVDAIAAAIRAASS